MISSSRFEIISREREKKKNRIYNFLGFFLLGNAIKKTRGEEIDLTVSRERLQLLLGRDGEETEVSILRLPWGIVLHASWICIGLNYFFWCGLYPR